ncbi:DUF2975 domain-containing protein [Parasphingopyxis sp.]|uniref:DUF2975 domain-containing protein n=1 Tax=Parasphingopyxis sp. TaxID=1920299 RepID=UPI002619AA60|nr:DUF2975 domain-containing protein [Parasphingopyxis sp.]
MTDNAQQDGGSTAAIAGRCEPWATGVLTIVVFLLIGDAILQPIIWSMSSNGYYPMELALVHVRDNVLAALPAYALLWVLWETRGYLARLRKGEIWLPATQRTLLGIGGGLVAAGLLGLAARPLVIWVRGDGFEFSLDPGWLALAGVGLLLVMIGRIMESVVEAALALKRENDEIL